MKYQILFSLNNNKKNNFKVSSAVDVISSLRVKVSFETVADDSQILFFLRKINIKNTFESYLLFLWLVS